MVTSDPHGAPPPATGERAPESSCVPRRAPGRGNTPAPVASGRRHPPQGRADETGMPDRRLGDRGRKPRNGRQSAYGARPLAQGCNRWHAPPSSSRRMLVRRNRQNRRPRVRAARSGRMRLRHPSPVCRQPPRPRNPSRQRSRGSGNPPVLASRLIATGRPCLRGRVPVPDRRGKRSPRNAPAALPSRAEDPRRRCRCARSRDRCAETRRRYPRAPHRQPRLCHRRRRRMRIPACRN
jgi:hypothetical protein